MSTEVALPTSVIDNTTGGPMVNDIVHRPLYENVILVIFLIVILLFGILGNIIVIVAVVKSRKLSSQLANYFLFNLAITDLSTCVLVIVFSLVAIINDAWPFGQTMCLLQCASNYTFIIVSMATLAFTGIDRYIAIVHSLRYMTFITKTRVVIMIISTWIQGAVFALIPVIMSWIHYDYWEMVCAIDWFISNHIVTYVIAANIFCFIIPGAVIVFTYAKIIIEVVNMDRRVHSLPISESARTKAMKTITSLIIVVVIFFICMTPFCLTKLFKVIYNDDANAVPGILNSVSTLIQYAASAANPLIYGIFRKDFRISILFLLRKVCISSTSDQALSEVTTFSAERVRNGTVFVRPQTATNKTMVKTTKLQKTQDQTAVGSVSAKIV